MKKFTMLLICLSMFGIYVANAQQRTITGTVTSSEDNMGLPGVSVTVKGTTIGAATDIDGKYVIKVPQDAQILVFSSVGMAPQEITIGASNSISVVMKPSTVDVGEVMVVAYGKSTKEAFTGSAAVVDGEKLEKRSVSNVTSALSGAAPGIQTASNTGQPGSAPSIRIRGVGSLSASSAPLYVVDGMPYDGDISAISGLDVESMTVLKDAASNALYGARGANGVILITTKKGKAGKTQVILDAKVGINQRGVPEYDIMTEPAEYYEKYYQAIFHKEIDPANYGKNIDEATNLTLNDILIKKLEYDIYSRNAGEPLVGLDGKLNPKAKLGRVYKGKYYLSNDDWYDEIFGKNQMRQEYSLSISGGNEKSSTYFSANYLNDKGIISNSGFERLTSRLKADYQVYDWLKVGGNMAYTNSISNYPGDQEGLSSKNLFYISRMVAPIYPMYIRDHEGNIIKDGTGKTLYDYGTGQYPGLKRPVMPIANPVSDLKLDKRYFKSDILSAKGFLDIDIYEGLNFMGNIGYDLDHTSHLDKGNAYYGQSSNYGGSIYRKNSVSQAITAQELLTYTCKFGEHNLDFLLGHETYSYKFSSLGGSKQMLYDKESEEISNAILKPSVFSSSGAYFVTGILSRVQYNLYQKYFASASFRRDASSRFHKDNRWGNFWSVGGSWLINKEEFLSNVTWIDLLKLKLSYGAQGNDALIYDKRQNYYPYNDQYDVKNSNDEFALELVYKGNKDITWETSYNFNTGFDFDIFDKRLSGSVEFFNRKVVDMLFYRPVASSAGFDSYPDNIGSMANTGFDFELNGIALKTNDIEWSLFLNGVFYKNEIKSLPPEFDRPEGYLKGRKLWKVGGSIYDMVYPVYEGVDRETGEAMWRITKEDGSFGKTKDYSEASEQKNMNNFGTSLPDLQGGFGTSINAYGIDFSVMFGYQLGGKVYDYAYARLMHEAAGAKGAGTNWHKDIADSWTVDNKDTDIPAVNIGRKDQNSASDRFLISATYLSINNITLGYTLPTNIVEKLKVGYVRFYAVADNIALFSKRKGLDPRQSFGGSTGFIYSPIRTMSMGVKVKF